MPLTPQITLTATLQDFEGNPVGAVGAPSKLRIALLGFGYLIPRVPGVCVIDKTVIEVLSTNGTISVPIWGNDVITPGSTFYQISVLDDRGNMVMTGAYLLTGGGTQDLSSLIPLAFPGQALQQPPIQTLFNSTPSPQNCGGTVNGVNAAFTFNSPSFPTPFIFVFAGGIFQTPTVDYTFAYSGSNIWTITFQSTSIPTKGPITVVLFNAIGSGGYIVVPWSASVSFVAKWSGPTTFDITLTGNVTASATSGLSAGQLVQFFVQQDATGNRAFTWPANVKNPPLINPAANSTTTALFMMRIDGNLYPILGWN